MICIVVQVISTVDDVLDLYYSLQYTEKNQCFMCIFIICDFGHAEVLRYRNIAPKIERTPKFKASHHKSGNE